MDEEDYKFISTLLKESTTAWDKELFPEGNTKVTWKVYESIMNIWACFSAIDSDNDKTLNKEQLRLLL